MVSKKKEFSIMINNYGELIAKSIKGTLWSYQEYGSYQGDYIAVLYKDSSLYIYKGSYGSCSGCDFLQSYDEETLTNEVIKDYMKDVQPFIIVPQGCFPETEEELIALLPANTRNVYTDEGDDGYSLNEFKLKDVLEQIKKRQCDNLDIIETEAKRRGLI